MIDRDESLIGLKDEVNKFVETVDLSVQENDLVYVTKKLIFLKYIMNSLEDSYYCGCLISDFLQMLSLFHNDSMRLFYMVYRSAIENSIRFFLGINKKDYVGVNDLFREFKSLFNSNELDLYAFIKGQYTDGCNFTHCNISADLNLFEFYSDTTFSDKPTCNDIKRLFRIEKNYLQKLIELVIMKKTSYIDRAFYRENQQLKFLLSKSEYNKYKLYLEKI